MKKILFIFLMAALVSSCRKDQETITLSGSVTDPYQNTSVAGAKVTLQANGVIGGVYNSSYVTLGTMTTDASGHFEFVVDESAYDSYRFTFMKDGYYMLQEVVSSSNVSPESPYIGSFDFISRSVLKIHVLNSTPFDVNDKITFSFLNNPYAGADCCSSLPASFSGMSIDTTFNCLSVGGFDLFLFKTITKNSSVNNYTDTIHTVPCDTTEVNLLY